MPDYEEYYRGKIINQKGRDISKVEEMLDEADGDPVRPPTAKELRHLAQYSGYDALGQYNGYDPKPQPTAQQGDGWKLGAVLTLIAIIVIVGLALK